LIWIDVEVANDVEKTAVAVAVSRLASAAVAVAVSRLVSRAVAVAVSSESSVAEAAGGTEAVANESSVATEAAGGRAALARTVFDAASAPETSTEVAAAVTAASVASTAAVAPPEMIEVTVDWPLALTRIVSPGWTPLIT
jgi:hypothetical protein